MAPELLDRVGPYKDGDADVYACVFRYHGHVYFKRAILSGCVLAVRSGDKSKELSYQTMKAARELVRTIDGSRQT